MKTDRSRIAYVAAPDGAHGGGMGRVKDYIVESPPQVWGGLEPRPLVTRDGSGKLGSLARLWEAAAAIRRGARDGSLALVHVNMGDRGSALRKAMLILQAHASGVPVFLHLHAVEMEKLPAAVRRGLGRAFRLATRVIVLGERYRRFVMTEFGVAPERIDILWNGVPVEVPAARRHAARDEPLTILFLGTLGERKGTHDLIAALADVPQAGSGWRVRFAGPGDLDRYRREVAAAGFADRAAFLGWLDQTEARAAVAAADMLVLPSYDEGLPLVILEALGLGTPVIATPVGVIPEVLTHDEDVVFVEPGDRAGLAAAMTRVLGDAALRQRLCDNGLALFRRTFSIEGFRSNLLAIWQRGAAR